MTRRQLTRVIAAGVIAVLVAGTVDALRSSEPSGSSPSRVATSERLAAGAMTIPAETTPEALPRCTAQNLGVSIDVLGGTAAVVVRHVWGRPCHLAPLAARLSLTDRVGRRVRLAAVDEAHPAVQASVAGDFSPGFEQLIDIPYLAEPQPGESCDRKGPFTAFVNVGPYSAQRKLSGGEVGLLQGRVRNRKLLRKGGGGEGASASRFGRRKRAAYGHSSQPDGLNSRSAHSRQNIRTSVLDSPSTPGRRYALQPVANESLSTPQSRHWRIVSVRSILRVACLSPGS
jgi:hypothetical protein